MVGNLHMKPIFQIEINKASVTDFELMLDSHDWYYMYSDDSRYYDRGRKESTMIRLVRTSLEDRGELTEEKAEELIKLRAPTL